MQLEDQILNSPNLSYFSRIISLSSTIMVEEVCPENFIRVKIKIDIETDVLSTIK